MKREMTRKERINARKELAKKYEGIALMSSSFVEREYEKLFSFENKTYGGILEFLKGFDFFTSGLQNLSFESPIDSNGYYTKVYIKMNYKGETSINILEGGCVRLNGKWIKHPDKGWTILKNKTFETNKELRFILNSEMIKRKVGTQTVLSRVGFYTDNLFDDDLEVRFKKK